jgi:plasmid stabilization system protein ParE
MKYSVEFAPEAESQLLALYLHIALTASPDIATDYTDSIIEQCQTLSTFPNRGMKRDDIRPGVRVFGFRKRVSIAFAVVEDVVTILGIYYCGQNFEGLLNEDE